MCPNVPGVYEFKSRPDVWWKFASWILLANNDEIELDNLCPTTAAEVVENLSEDNEKGVDFESHLKN